MTTTGNDGNAGTAGSPFRTIAHAAAVAANGDTIYLHAGVYGDEQGIVTLGTKDLVLQGDGAATTTLRPHTTLLASLPLVQPGATVIAAQRVGIAIAGTARVQVRDLTIDAQRLAPPSGHVVGVHVRGGADVLLDHLRITGCRAAAFGGPGLALAVGVRGDVVTGPTVCAVRGATLRDFGNAALRAVASAEVDLEECRLTGNRGEALAPDQTGVLAEAGAIATVRSCRLGEFAGASGTCVRFADQGANCAVEGCRFGAVAIGIDVARSTPALVPGQVRLNRVHAIDRALRVHGNSGLQIVGNDLFTASATDPGALSDDTAGNNWQGNHYAVPPGTASVAIPGGTSVDASPQPGIVDFEQLTRVACGGSPVAIAVADFDGDGHTDFATLDITSPAVGISIGLWRPSGHVVTSTAFGGAGLRPIGIVTGDFDGAPGRDLAVLTAPLPPATAGAAFWVFSNDGAGAMTLLHQENLPGFVNPTAIATASFNANPFADLVVLDDGAPPFTLGSGRTLLNDGTGTVWFASPLPIAFTASGLACACGDLDGDGKQDLAIAEGSATTGRVHWLRGNGIGGFTAAPGSPFALPASPGGVAIADVDGDGSRELIASATAGPLPLQRGVVQVFAYAAGTLQPWLPIATELGPTRLVAADLDLDSFDGALRPELLALDPPAHAVRLLGSFEPGVGMLAGGAVTQIDSPLDFAIADVDGDGYRDLIAAEPRRLGVAWMRGKPSILHHGFGFGCPGQTGHEPRLQARGTPGLPVQPNVSFQLVIVDGAPLTLAAIAIAFGPAAVLQPCNIQVADLDDVRFLSTDAAGKGVMSVPVPAAPDLRGLGFWLQGGVLDPAATTSIIPGISLTAGLLLRLGN